MNHKKHLFILNEHYSYASLGDTCIVCLAYYAIIKHYGLDAKILILNNKYEEIWFDVLGKQNVYTNINDIPDEYKFGVLHKPTSKDIGYGQWAANDFIEGFFWENAFFDTKNIHYNMPLLYKCNFNSKNVFIYPEEKTDANKIFDSKFWINTYEDLKKQNYTIYYMGSKNASNLQHFYNNCVFDYEFEPNIFNLKHCVSNCSLAVGTSTGPTWFCLFSDIRQIVFQSKSNAKYWNFDRYQFSLLKNIKTIHTFESVLKDIVHK